MVKKAYAWAGALVFLSIQLLLASLPAGQAPAPHSSSNGLVAEASQRIEFDRLEVRVTQGTDRSIGKLSRAVHRHAGRWPDD